MWLKVHDGGADVKQGFSQLNDVLNIGTGDFPAVILYSTMKRTIIIRTMC